MSTDPHATASNQPGRPVTDRRWLAFAAFAGLTVLLYWPTVMSIVGRWWNSPTYSSGLLIGPVAVWLVWRVARSGRLDDAPPAPWAAGLVLLVGTGWLLGKAASVEVIQQLAIPAFLLAGGLTLFGWRGLKALLVPVGILYFVIPAWDYVMPILQAITVDVVGASLEFLRVPAYIEGNRVFLPVGTFQIVEGCSGLHFFMTAGALAALYAHLNLESTRRAAVLFVVALAVSLLANWIRVAAVIIAGYVTDMQTFLVQVDHYYFGWAVFVVMMLPVLWLGRRLESPAGPARTGPRPPEVAEPGTVVAVLFAIVAAPVAWLALTLDAARPADGLELAARAGEWTQAGPAAPDWQPVQPGASDRASAAYTDGDTVLDVHVAYYPAQRDGQEIVGYGNRLAREGDGRLARLPGEPGWAVISRGEAPARVVRYLYVVGGRTTSSGTRAKLYQVVGALTRRPDAMLIAVSARCAQDCENAKQSIARFERAVSNAHGSLEGSVSLARRSSNENRAGA